MHTGGVRADAEATWTPPHPTDLRLTLGRLGHGPGDPTHSLDESGAVWRTTLTPTGAATMQLSQPDRDTLRCRAWGPGAADAIASAPELLGAHDDSDGFEPRHPLLEDAHRRFAGLRVPKTGRVFEALVPAILEQKVISLQAHASWRQLLHRFGSDAPGPVRMKVVPSAREWARIPSWEWHRAGVDPQRSRTIVTAARVADSLERLTALSPIEAGERLRSLPGIGVWTVAEVACRAFGDADALSVGDYNLAGYVGHALFGAETFTDDDLVRELEPWRGHRYRVVRLLEASGARGRPRRASRMAFVDHTWH